MKVKGKLTCQDLPFWQGGRHRIFQFNVPKFSIILVHSSARGLICVPVYGSRGICKLSGQSQHGDRKTMSILNNSYYS